MATKDETAKYVQHYIRQIKNRFGWRVTTFRSDQGTEFVNKTLKELFSSEGIKHEITPPYTPQLNGVAERMNRTIKEEFLQYYFFATPEEKKLADGQNLSLPLMTEH